MLSILQILAVNQPLVWYERGCSHHQGKVGKDYTFDTLIESMKKDGWKGDPIDVVNMSDGAPTSLDNTRVLAARQAGRGKSRSDCV